MNWRRWVAMLCIALLAFVMFEEASPAHAAADLAQAAITFDAVNGADQVQPSSDQDQYPDGPFQPAHHCCAAHTSSVAPVMHNTAVLAQPSLRVRVPLSVEAALSHAPEGLERPPKATAIV
ncbi:hypothetical protein [Vitreimonas flagellata]|uniref:hypothetical protein n=1 Tax=Vitreimonas flagellata TaxID=2560861 RepID=UPI001074AC33|nr:hypothetical protein [Vitreimonas flagellata]